MRSARAPCPHFTASPRTPTPRPATINGVPGVYLSYPFCAQKCTYCNFASDVLPRAIEEPYVEALLREIRGHVWQWTPETIYLGGGTPSMMDAAQLTTIVNSIPGRPWSEATLEVAPGTITPEKARTWRDAGINRVSLGVQSFVDTEIRRTGRRHSANMVAREVDILRAAGITNFNIDLIAGLSGQTPASWQQSLDFTARLFPPHVSVYMLEVDEDSRLGKEMLLGGVRYGAADTPSDDTVAGFYETAVAYFAALGVQRYEISNFARPGFESRHNLKYWKLEPYAGFGADAHSFDGRLRARNPESVEEYLAGALPVPSASTPDEHLFVGLRLTQGVRPTAEDWRQHAQSISRFISLGLLDSSDGVLRLTDRGVLLSNEVFQEFLAA